MPHTLKYSLLATFVAYAICNLLFVFYTGITGTYENIVEQGITYTFISLLVYATYGVYLGIVIFTTDTYSVLPASIFILLLCYKYLSKKYPLLLTPIIYILISIIGGTVITLVYKQIKCIGSINYLIFMFVLLLLGLNAGLYYIRKHSNV